MTDGAPAAPAPPAAPASAGPKAGRTHKGTFAKGHSGNPKGRVKGSRNQLCIDYITDLHDIWITDGKNALRRLRKENVAEFVRAVGRLVPQQHGLSQDDKDMFRQVWERAAARAASRQAAG